MLLRYGVSSKIRPGDGHPMDATEVKVEEFVVNRKIDCEIHSNFCIRKKSGMKGWSNFSTLSKSENSLRIYSGVSSIPRIFGLSKFPVRVAIISEASAHWDTKSNPEIKQFLLLVE